MAPGREEKRQMRWCDLDRHAAPSCQFWPDLKVVIAFINLLSPTTLKISRSFWRTTHGLSGGLVSARRSLLPHLPELFVWLELSIGSFYDRWVLPYLDKTVELKAVSLCRSGSTSRSWLQASKENLRFYKLNLQVFFKGGKILLFQIKKDILGNLPDLPADESDNFP